MRADPIRFANVVGRDVGDGTSPVAIADYINTQFDPSLSWRDIDWIRGVWDGPIVIKGIQTVADARLAADAGVRGHRALEPRRTPARLVARRSSTWSNPWPTRSATGSRSSATAGSGAAATS